MKITFFVIILALFSSSIASASHFGLFFSTTKSWPNGTDGTVTFSSGVTYQVQLSSNNKLKIADLTNNQVVVDQIGQYVNGSGINETCVLDFSTMTLPAGATLDISSGCKWLILGLRNGGEIDGTLKANSNTVNGSVSYSTKLPNKTGALNGTALTYTLQQASGGPGGNGGGSYANCSGPFNDGGIGGGSGPNGGIGGAGGIGGNKGGTNWNRGSGGGGGSPGSHGQGIAIVSNSSLSGAGLIEVTGSNGTNGGPGGNGQGDGACNSAGGGGGGGGGSGGSGGSIVINYKTSLSSNLALINSAGSGGSGAGGGFSYGNGGGNGNGGFSGSTQTNQIP
jgi:hypothetical protein